MAYSTQVRETETKHTHTLERLLKDERHRLTCLRSQAKLLEIDRDDLREVSVGLFQRRLCLCLSLS